MRHKLIVGTAAAAVVLGSGTGIAVAAGDDGDDGDQTVTGAKADRATTAAVVATGGGHANSVARDSENGATWEVDVTKPGGGMVDVRLDESIRVVVIEGDRENDNAGRAVNNSR